MGNINSDLFEVVAIQRFKNQNCFVQHLSVNEDSDHFLCTCSDRALRLYKIDTNELARQSAKVHGRS
jgi:WD40 repeat protein